MNEAASPATTKPYNPKAYTRPDVVAVVIRKAGARAAGNDVALGVGGVGLIGLGKKEGFHNPEQPEPVLSYTTSLHAHLYSR